MKKALVFSMLAIFIGVVGMQEPAHAKRFGMGSSFGKSFSKPKNFSRPAPKQGVGKAMPARNGSRAGGMMGILGGLAMGGLLGALFFGGGFEGINLFDILLIGGVIFLVMRMLRSRQPEYAAAGHHHQSFGHGAAPAHQDAFMGEQGASAVAKPDIDAEQFIQAARDIFARMQQDWDSKNMDDIRKFCTPEVAQHIEADMQRLGEHRTRTDIGFLDAEIVDTWMESGLAWAAVRFQAALKEETLDAAGKVVESEQSQVDEIWIFQHDPSSDDPTWYLAGIQQA